MSHTQSPYPCDPAFNTHLSIHDDQDRGGVPLTPTAVDTFSDDGHGLVHNRRRLSSRVPVTLDSLWNIDSIDGGIRLPVNTVNDYSHQYPSADNRLSHDLTNTDYATAHGQIHESTLGAASTATRLSFIPVSNEQHSGPSTSVSGILASTHITASSPTETSSTRWPGTETTQTVYQLEPSQELLQQHYSWVEYDVADFLERWDIQYDMGEAGLMHVNPDRKSQWQPPTQNPVSSRQRDIQGLDWTALKTSRSKARLARRMLYPLIPRYAWSPTERRQDPFGQGNMYAFRDFYGQHKARYSHGQLRHVLAARSRNDIFYAAQSKVMHTSLSSPAYANAVIDLSGASTNPNRAVGDTLITVVAASPLSDFEGYYSDAVLVAGGFAGEYALLNLNSVMGEPATEGFVTHAHESVTTHVHTLSHRRTGALGAAFCSNDRKLRLLDIDSNTWTSEFEYDKEINCAVTSPDGRLRAVVGDMWETLITDAERGNVLFSTQQHTGYGFACAWAPNGWHVATGGEDGKVVVYDARRWDVPLTALACEMSCARSLHFTTSNRGGPALVVAESDDIVTVYDANNWHDRQTMDFFGSVVGAASVDDGRELIVANGDRTVGGLLVFERQEYLGDFEQRGGELDLFTQQRPRSSRKRTTQVDDPAENYPKRFGLDFDDLIL